MSDEVVAKDSVKIENKTDIKEALETFVNKLQPLEQGK